MWHIDILSYYVTLEVPSKYRTTIWLLSVEKGGVASLECAADLSRHSRPVNCVRFSPSGEFLASGDDDSSIIVWKMKTSSDPVEFPSGEEENFKEQWISVKVLRGHLQDVYDLSWSPDSKNLISGSVDNSAILWEVSSGKNLGILGDHKGFVQGVAWDPCGQYVATMSSDRVCRVFNSTTRKVVSRVYKGHLPGVAAESKPTHYFHDDTLKSFFRRLTFTPDGEFLIVPSGVVEEPDKNPKNSTILFSRHCLNKPVLYLPSLSQYTVAVRCCPTLFTLRQMSSPPLFNLPYRVIIAVATQCSVVLYDTQHAAPFAFITNIHYTRLTDLSWSSDGRVLVVSSTDGYCSVITFAENELGTVYTGQKEEGIEVANLAKECSENKDKEIITSQDTEKSKSADVEKCPKKPSEVIVLDPTEDANMCVDMNSKMDGNECTDSKQQSQLLPSLDNSSKSAVKSVTDVKESPMEVDDFQLVYEGTVTEPVLESGSTTKSKEKIEAEPCEIGAKSTSLEIEKTARPLMESPEKPGDVASSLQKESTSPKPVSSGKVNTTPGNSNKKAPRRVQLITLSSPRSRKKLLS
ncbi:chromatin assembly factor 1 subunit B isoform X2 [Homalodisca vitripennis]|uniref:chromatin assembly factor 1 subunit B isoform X2 n=1 Tax=Homalodisca vitripennis TaxID=197043 RepID=UPI001EEC5D7F|nr:chromatin assembly factor 1 subunit B isoform X2 [Homalodisca vitripennis]